MKEKENPVIYSVGVVIRSIRGQKVILDSDLAQIYGVTTKRINEQVKRNSVRFPPDFTFRLSQEEASDLLCSRSQTATLKRGHNIKHLPYAFTEHGAIMAATVLNSHQAVKMTVFVVRAFIQMRNQMLNHVELEKRLAVIEKTLISHDVALSDLYQKLRPLLLPPPDPPRKQIGFKIKETRTSYSLSRKRKCKDKKVA